MSSFVKATSHTISRSVRPRQPRYQMITQILREQIQDGTFKPGQTLPSYRDLMETHEVTVGTIRQAMMTLQNQGLIQSMPGVGCIVNDPQTSKLRCRVGIAIIGKSEMHWLINQLAELQQQIDSLQIDVSLRFVESDQDEHLQQLLAWSRRHDGVILSGHVTLKVAQALAAESTNTVQLGELIDGPCPSGLSHITVDAPGLAELAVTHLVSLGHQRIALCAHNLKSQYFQMICNGFKDTMAQYGHVDGTSILRIDVRDTNYIHNAITWLKSLPQMPTAIIVESGTRATLMINTLREIGMRVPQDISVLGIASGRRDPRVLDDLSGIITSGHQMVLSSMETLQKMHESQVAGGPVAIRIEKITPRYMPGTTAAVPPG